MDREAVRALAESLEADDAILAETVEVLRTTVPGYESLPTDSLLESARRNRALSIRTILDGRAPDADTLAEPVTLMDERMSQGMPIVSVLAGFRLSMSVILRHLLDLAPRHGVPPDVVLSFSTLLWALGDVFTTRAVVVYRDRSVAQAVADSARRAQWIGDAVVSGLSRTELLAGAATYDVPQGRGAVRALRIALDAGETVDPAGRLEDWARRDGGRALVAPRGEGAVGILVGDTVPETEPEGCTVAMGSPVSLQDLHESFEVATRVLAAAHRVGMRGLVDVGRLSWRMGISTSPETTAMLLRRYVDPIRAEGSFGDLLLEALRAYLANGLSIPQAASSIPVHVNTLRYRLKRYRQITRADLQDHETVIEVSWALAADSGGADRRGHRGT